MKIVGFSVILLLLFLSGCIGQNENLVFSCGELTQPNTNYKLANDISLLEVAGNPLGRVCISIKADNVTLDCGGKRIYANNSPIEGRGILVQDSFNVTVKNCFVEGFGTISRGSIDPHGSGTSFYGAGIMFENSDSCKIINNTTNKNSNGIYLKETTDCYISKNTSEDGIQITDSENNSISENKANLVLQRSNNNLVFDNTLINSSIFNSNSNTIRNNSFNYGLKGLRIYKSNENILTGNKFQYNTNGIEINSSFDNTFSNNIIKFNEEGGILMDNDLYGAKSEGNKFGENTICGNYLVRTDYQKFCEVKKLRTGDGCYYESEEYSLAGRLDFCENVLFSKEKSCNIVIADISCQYLDQIDLGGNKWNIGEDTACGLERESKCSDVDPNIVDKYEEYKKSKAPEIIEIDSCRTIRKDNAIYRLTGDVTNNAEESLNCFAVFSNDVTLDCQGNRIYSSENHVGSGILSENTDNLTIQNCVIEGWAEGANFSFVKKLVFSNNTSSGNLSGLLIKNGSYAHIKNNEFSGNNIGMDLYFGIVMRANGNEISGNNIGVRMEDYERRPENRFASNIICGNKEYDLSCKDSEAIDDDGFNKWDTVNMEIEGTGINDFAGCGLFERECHD